MSARQRTREHVINQTAAQGRRGWIPVTLLTLTVSLGLASAAQAQFWERTNWSWNTDGGDCLPNRGQLSDPVGIVFYGQPATWQVVHDDITFHGRALYGQDWSHDDEPSPVWPTKQWINDSGACRDNQSANANDGGAPVPPRFHTRLWQKVWRDRKGRYEVVATPHYEVGCGTFRHGVVSFDAGRRKFIKLMNNDYHNVSGAYWGNTHTVRQCGNRDWVVRSNGDVAWILFPD